MSISLTEHYQIVDAKQEQIEKLQKQLWDYAQANHRYYENTEKASKIIEEELLTNPCITKLCNTDLRQIHCLLCTIQDCSTKDDPEECLKTFAKKETEDGKQA